MLAFRLWVRLDFCQRFRFSYHCRKHFYICLLLWLDITQANIPENLMRRSDTMRLAEQVLHTARRLVLADQAAYDAIWASTLTSPSEHDAVDVLDLLVKNAISHCSASLRQLNRKVLHTGENHGWIDTLSRGSSTHNSHDLERSSSSAARFLASALDRSRSRNSSIMWDELLESGIEGTVDSLSPVQSLDQLFFQATALAPLLLSKVQAWAAGSGGCFAATGTRTGTFVRWIDVQEVELQSGGQVRWAGIKSVQRAIEKSTRSYGKVC